MTIKSPPLVNVNSIGCTQSDQKFDNPIIPYYSLYSDRMVIHPKPFVHIVKKKINAISISNLKKPKYTGYMSPATRSRVKKVLNAWLSSILYYNHQDTITAEYAKRRPIFVTTTLSSKQIHSDKEIKRFLLDPFIKALKRKYSGIKYLWRAESQKNGNIHFHLILDIYIPWKDIRTLWNHYQNKLGYIDRFCAKHGHTDPNSTDVKGVKEVKNFIDYIVKYCAKEGEYREIQGHIWGMSDELRECKIYQDLLDWNLSELLTKAINDQMIKLYQQEYCSILYFTHEFRKTPEYRKIQWRSSRYYVELYRQLYLHPPVKKRLIDTVKETVIEGSKQGCLFTDNAYNKLLRNPADEYDCRKVTFNKKFETYVALNQVHNKSNKLYK